MRTNFISMAEDLSLSMERFVAPNKERIEKMVSMLQKMEKSLDAYLDKPLDENNVHFACGDALENVTGALKELIIAMDYYHIEIKAKAKSWEIYPPEVFDGEDRNEFARDAYITGYIDAKQSIK